MVAALVALVALVATRDDASTAVISPYSHCAAIVVRGTAAVVVRGTAAVVVRGTAAIIASAIAVVRPAAVVCAAPIVGGAPRIVDACVRDRVCVRGVVREGLVV